MRRIVNNIPNAITSLNLLSGCMAVIMAFHADAQYWMLAGRQWVYVFIFAAAVFDFCDGFSARTLRAYSILGKELDSLADLVSFGVAPAMLMLNLMLDNGAGALAFVSLLIAVGGALRLAKFNVDTSQATVFKGLPIPANALFWIGVAGWQERFATYPGTAFLAVCIVIVSWLMVSNIKMFSLKFKNLSFYDNAKRYGIVAAAVAFLVVYGISGLAWTILLYVLVSVFTQKHAD